jgi:hypothetical protein
MSPLNAVPEHKTDTGTQLQCTALPKPVADAHSRTIWLFYERGHQPTLSHSPPLTHSLTHSLSPSLALSGDATELHVRGAVRSEA